MDRDQDIETILTNHFAAELGDPTLAGELTKILMEDALSWRAPTVRPDAVRTILGFTFGNRMLANGNREPGPVNAALADVAVGLHRATGARVVAQWEVAEAMGDRIPADALDPIFPQRDAQSEPRFLSTGGVIEDVLARSGGDPAAFGTVAIVAVQDHAWRCAAICRRHGLQAGLPEGWPMPDLYDETSGQPWTRDRLAYLLHDLHCRALDRRDDRIRALSSAP